MTIAQCCEAKCIHTLLIRAVGQEQYGLTVMNLSLFLQGSQCEL